MKRVYAILTLAVALFGSWQCSPAKKNKSGKEKTVYVKPKENGIDSTFDDKGHLIATITYKNGKRDGVARNYYLEGGVSMEVLYKNGLREGTSTQYYTTGAIYRTTEYHGDLKNGWQKTFTISGKPVMTQFFEENQLQVGGVEYNKDGTLKKEPKIVIREENSLFKDGKYKVHFSLSEPMKSAEYFIGTADKSGVDWSTMSRVNTDSKDKGHMEIMLDPGEMVTRKLTVVAKFKRYSDFQGLAVRSFNLAVTY